MDKFKAVRHTVYGGKMPVSEFAEQVLYLVNLRSSVKNSVINVKTVEGTNIVIVDAMRDMSEELKPRFNSNDDVLVEELEVYNVDWADLGKKYADEIERKVWDEDKEITIIYSDMID